MVKLTEVQARSVRQRLYAVAFETAQKWASIYEQLHWKWGTGVPNEDEIYEHIMLYIDEIEFDTDDAEYKISSGGITVGYSIIEYDEEEPIVEIILDFIDSAGGYATISELEK